ncbi:hypothetical protein C2E25_16600 [Geothermobacter hydrogeniphilus]|uniref:PEGA domain-containing protein n=2 Tax=Geothermobacter hydrogeniphilus TaxID=1969733 RepID=A0A2K2H5W0_9BACT|nr:hypothetical protein C2E25_16600 [Geothermobacter hydrogeniphilus]
MLVLLLFVAGCGGYYSGTTQKQTVSALQFVGNVDNARVVVDGAEPFSIASIQNYEIAPGKHSIKIYRGDRLLVNRVVFLGNHQTTEVRVP